MYTCNVESEKFTSPAQLLMSTSISWTGALINPIKTFWPLRSPRPIVPSSAPPRLALTRSFSILESSQAGNQSLASYSCSGSQYPAATESGIHCGLRIQEPRDIPSRTVIVRRGRPGFGSDLELMYTGIGRCRNRTSNNMSCTQINAID